MAVDVAADDPLGEPVGGDVAAVSGSPSRSFSAPSSSDFQNAGDVLLQLAHHHVAAVEAEIAEACGRALGGEVRRRPGRLPDRPGRSGRAPSRDARWWPIRNVAERHAVPRVALDRLPSLADAPRLSSNGTGCDRPSAKPKCSRPMPLSSSRRLSGRRSDDLDAVRRERRGHGLDALARPPPRSHRRAAAAHGPCTASGSSSPTESVSRRAARCRSSDSRSAIDRCPASRSPRRSPRRRRRSSWDMPSRNGAREGRQRLGAQAPAARARSR